jgi:DNA-binding transcriptional MerR regulator
MTDRGKTRPPADPERDDSYTLEELCDQAGVTVRTVRYYISEGLLPPPAGHGASARYTDDHRARLDVIGALKAQYLPLREIRRTLDGMSPHQIADAAAAMQADAPAAAAPVTTALREDSSAADYIAGILEQPARSPRPTPRYAPASTPATTADASWRRVPISGEAELLIEEDTYRRRREQIDSLVAWAQRILNGT